MAQSFWQSQLNEPPSSPFNPAPAGSHTDSTGNRIDLYSAAAKYNSILPTSGNDAAAEAHSHPNYQDHDQHAQQPLSISNGGHQPGVNQQAHRSLDTASREPASPKRYAAAEEYERQTHAIDSTAQHRGSGAYAQAPMNQQTSIPGRFGSHQGHGYEPGSDQNHQHNHAQVSDQNSRAHGSHNSNHAEDVTLNRYDYPPEEELMKDDNLNIQQGRLQHIEDERAIAAGKGRDVGEDHIEGAPLETNTCGCGRLSAPAAVGPFIKFSGFQHKQNTWTGSALFVCQPNVSQNPSLTYRVHNAGQNPDAVQNPSTQAAAPDGSYPKEKQGATRGVSWDNDVTSSNKNPDKSEGKKGVWGKSWKSWRKGLQEGVGESTIEGDLLDEYKSWRFWRFDLKIPVESYEQKVDYWVNVDGENVEIPPSGPHTFYIPGLHQPWHWGFYSCAGFSNDVPVEDHEKKYGGFDKLWLDVLAVHKGPQPLHLLVGGGDQLYCDDVFQTPAMKEWLEIPDKGKKYSAPFTPQMAADVAAYYFHHYCIHWSYGALGECTRCIPQVMTWDDHDLFDGWGSYPYHIQNCQVFQGMYTIMRQFYLLFQQHSTPDRAKDHGMFGGTGFSQLVMLGPSVAVALPDQRAERTTRQIMSVETYMDMFFRMCQLPGTVQHLVIVATVPVVYPHLTTSQKLLNVMEKLMEKTPWLYKALKATGLTHMVYSYFDEPELLDDLKDHWEAPQHKDERRFLIEHLQMMARARHWRVSLISGDVHLCAVGRLYSWPKMKNRLSHDARFMPQIISSAIVNCPPPDLLLKIMRVITHAGFTNKHTRNKMCKVFNDHKSRKRLLNMRNWCVVTQITNAAGALTTATSTATSVFSSGDLDTMSPMTNDQGFNADRTGQFAGPPGGSMQHVTSPEGYINKDQEQQHQRRHQEGDWPDHAGAAKIATANISQHTPASAPAGPAQAGGDMSGHPPTSGEASQGQPSASRFAVSADESLDRKSRLGRMSRFRFARQKQSSHAGSLVFTLRVEDTSKPVGVNTKKGKRWFHACSKDGKHPLPRDVGLKSYNVTVPPLVLSQEDLFKQAWQAWSQ